MSKQASNSGAAEHSHGCRHLNDHDLDHDLCGCQCHTPSTSKEI